MKRNKYQWRQKVRKISSFHFTNAKMTVLSNCLYLFAGKQIVVLVRFKSRFLFMDGGVCEMK